MVGLESWLFSSVVLWMCGIFFLGVLLYRSPGIRESFIDTFGSVNIFMIIFWPITVPFYLLINFVGLLEYVWERVWYWIRLYNKTISGR